MALDTPKNLRNQVLYSVFVRQYSSEGTFEALRRDLDRIQALGADILWLMPIHPIGAQGRKGTVGSPYAIRDYRAVDPALGTLDDFRRLVGDLHARGMKCIIDVVYNHTSPDSVLAKTHPEWFFRRADGSFGNKCGDWADVIDLDYRQPALWDYQIETLKQWAQIVDGFRCDVAPLVPLEFWLRARREVAAVRPGCLWLAESVEPEFICQNRAKGISCLSDSELYQAFDVCYDYDIYWDYIRCLSKKCALADYARAISRQEVVYPDNYVKLRVLENHDRPRAAALIPGARALRSWTALLYFQKGLTLLYNGQERAALTRPSLFERDPIDWTGADLSPLLSRLAEIKKLPLFADSSYELHDAGGGVLAASHRRGDQALYGFFPTAGEPGPVLAGLPDGRYADLLSGAEKVIDGGVLALGGEPVILQLIAAAL